MMPLALIGVPEPASQVAPLFSGMTLRVMFACGVHVLPEGACTCTSVFTGPCATPLYSGLVMLKVGGVGSCARSAAACTGAVLPARVHQPAKASHIKSGQLGRCASRR